MKIKTSELKALVEEMQAEGLDVSFFGRYRGRFYHDGFAITCGESVGASEVGATMARLILLNDARRHMVGLLGVDHRDQLALGTVLCWSATRFEDDGATPDRDTAEMPYANIHRR